MSKVTIEEIGERLNSLDSIYYEELVGALKELKNLGTIWGKRSTKSINRFL